MSNFRNFVPRTARGVLLSTVSAIALTAGLSGPTGPGGGGSTIESEAAAVVVDAPIDSIQEDQNFADGNDEPPKAIILPIKPDRFVGHPDEIEGWTAKHFQPWEFKSKGNGLVNVDARLVARLDAVREELGLPIYITSGYRDPAYNTRVGGARNSQHLHGRAVDIDMSGYDVETRYRLMTLLVKHGFTSFGSYTNSPSMLHADIRERAAKWHYGSGTHPEWFSRALDSVGWKRGATAEEMMATARAKTEVMRQTLATAENAEHSRSMTITLSKPFDGSMKLEGLYEIVKPDGWGGSAYFNYEDGTNDFVVGIQAKRKRPGFSTGIGAAYNDEGVELRGSVTIAQ